LDGTIEWDEIWLLENAVWMESALGSFRLLIGECVDEDNGKRYSCFSIKNCKVNLGNEVLDFDYCNPPNKNSDFASKLMQRNSRFKCKFSYNFSSQSSYFA
jgi:hypothetical protein